MSNTRRQVEKRGSDPGLLVLVGLADAQARTALGIAEDVECLFGVELDLVAVRGALSRLARGGLVEPLVTEDSRQPYRISGGGAEVIRDELMRLANLARNRLHTGNRSVPLPFRPGELGQDAVMGSYEAPYPLYRKAAPGVDRTGLTRCVEEARPHARRAT
jgi:hypothetical protein